MANDDLSTSTSSMTKRPISRKFRIRTHNRMSGKNLVDDLHTNGIPTIGNNTTSRLPSLLSKSSVCFSASETMRFKRYRPQQKDIFNISLSSKIERQTTNIIPQTRLPSLCTTSNDNDQKQRSEYQRRQIYALNHLMRELEQEQFRQFCKLNGIGTVNSEEQIVSNNEDPNKQSST